MPTLEMPRVYDPFGNYAGRLVSVTNYLGRDEFSDMLVICIVRGLDGDFESCFYASDIITNDAL